MYTREHHSRDNSPVSLGGLELYGKTTRVASIVVGARLTTDGGETDGNGALCTLLEEVGVTEILETGRAFPFTVGSRTLGVHDTLGDTLAVEVREKVW